MPSLSSSTRNLDLRLFVAGRAGGASSAQRTARPVAPISGILRVTRKN